VTQVFFNVYFWWRLFIFSGYWLNSLFLVAISSVGDAGIGRFWV
jgi:hypothetical protein